MHLDNLTVIFTSAVVSLVVCLFSWVLVFMPGSAPWRRYWALGNSALTGGLLLLMGQGTWTPWVSVILANLGILGGYFLLELGLRAFCYRPAPRWLPWVHFGVLLGGYWVFTIFGDSIQGRSVVHSLLAIGVMARMTVLLQIGIPELRKRSRVLVVALQGAFLLVILVYVARMILSFWEPGTNVLNQNGSLNLLFLFTLLGMIAWTLGFIILDILRNQKLLESSLATRNRLFDLVAHDLRGPVGGVANLLQMLRDSGEFRGEAGNWLELCSLSAQNTSDLLEKMLNWSRGQRGEIRLAPQAISASPFLDNTIGPLRSVAEAKGIALQVAAPATLTFWGDEPSLSTVVRNLATNALKFSHRGSMVRIEAAELANHAVIKVADQGKGLPEKTLEILNEGGLPESRPGTEGEPGTGLGLSLCREFVHANKGTLEFESSPLGTTVTVTLPLPTTLS